MTLAEMWRDESREEGLKEDIQKTWKWGKHKPRPIQP